MLVKMLNEVQPAWLWLSPACEGDLPADKSERASIQCRKRWKQAAESCILLAKEQLQAGRHVLWAWPSQTKSWTRSNAREFFRFMKQSGQLFESHVHACQVESRGPDKEPRSSQEWKIWTSTSSLAQCLQNTCDGSHDHASPNVSGTLENLPFATCQRALREMELHRTLQKERNEGVASEHEGVFDHFCGDVLAAEELQDPEKLSKEERVIHAQLMKLHRRRGHPNNRALCNLLRTREVDPHVIRIAEKLRCDVCQQMRLATPHGKVALDRCEQLWHTLQIDHVDFRWGNVVVQALVLVDEASQYCLVHEVH